MRPGTRTSSRISCSTPSRRSTPTPGTAIRTSPRSDHPGELQDGAREKVRRLLRELVRDDATVDQWFGQFLTCPDRNREAVPPETAVSASDLTEALRSGRGLRRGPVARLAFIEHDDGSATLFANGDATILAPDLAYAARLVTGREQIPGR